ncbi:MAG: hypothetical protein UU05_C0024G0017 [Candidatus Curtissbacteria bacterium GW2011_GWA1_40_47]|uniref:Uncharacterized protein n=1 Tax=Candidatus Curtissbacteria bacterium RIFOXYA1_FULL_41_14 TaxID=1797737 RepID=A0A1F5HBU6_9BACT|nr:MAG: hypothetical protein UT95_C0015G0015 [Candidatus Curtissbacteria bacterium GW2011_GWB1_40_28]KKR60906.1 MAG: hypothetical protein UT99_C0005G0021 [Candidatus Curtissbacteria bacterium GW2011_GWA2_40_31]KKR61461.1 MAG: hypothetical protein UU00_C0013G0037 [Microgenomates group bacterium GW2011_GWC1_40_35]KKR65250.1 MAG: hypothetical protein UU05_C0024G0017 [Candidatus Curtissbacteria bacterium GW2011_GWA1_40_47]KKR77605.1 MAG: hypothetical protein UU19_C0007G0014 [Candidatus Curtissbacte
MKEQALANAFAVIIAAIYVICAAWVVIARDSFMAFSGNWIHGIDLETLPYISPNTGGLIFGFVTAVAAGWVAGYAFAWLYNKFSKK